MTNLLLLLLSHFSRVRLCVQLQLEHGLALLGMVPSNLRAKPPFPLPVLCASYLFSETSKARRPSWAPEMHLIYCCQPQTKWPLTLAILQRGWLPWWLRGQSLCLQCGRPGFNPWVGKSGLHTVHVVAKSWT